MIDHDPFDIVAVMQRPGCRGWMIFDASLLRDPNNRDPDVYLGARVAQGDDRIIELPSGSPRYAPDFKAVWRPIADNSPVIVTWKRDSTGLWRFTVLRPPPPKPTARRV
jgi:hypothetical protein